MKDSPEQTILAQISFDVPALFGDHHVVEVRRILLEMPGVQDVYASSCFHVVEVNYDPAKISEVEIKTSLTEAGYLGDLRVPQEVGVTGGQREGKDTFFRHTAVYEQTRQAVSFGQVVSYLGRPLWNCPGMGVITKKMEE
jgi:hypothetical protein